jgi:hypothetical protein
MPTPAEILASLTAIANDGVGFAIAWHVALALGFGAALVGWRPGVRTVAFAIALLPASAAGFAFAYGNLFNGIVLGATAVAIAMLAPTTWRGRVERARGWPYVAGLAMVVYGWTYPHFLVADPLAYVVAAPVGLVPCPTLAVAIGVALMIARRGERAWRLVLAGVGTFYALFGVLRLAVVLDLGLLVGAGVLAVLALRRSTAVDISPPSSLTARSTSS